MDMTFNQKGKQGTYGEENNKKVIWKLGGREGMCLASAGSAGRRWDWRGKGHFPVQ